MHGDYAGKFPQGRALYLYMYAHPGKKLNFMGGELGQLREWDEKREQDWLLLQYPNHDAFHRMLRDLNRLYLEHPALWAADFDPAGFAGSTAIRRKNASMRWSAPAAESASPLCSIFPTACRIMCWSCPA